MIGKLVRRIRSQGLSLSIQQYEDAIGQRVSLNYRQDPKRFKAMPRLKRWWLFTVDFVRSIGDRLAKATDHVLNDHRDIARNELEEFDVRLVDPNHMSTSSIVYAFGVARHIETEEMLAQRFGCIVHMFDPTPPALEFMAARTPDPKLVFDPIGVWTESGPVRFYTDRRPTVKNLSVVNMYHTDSYIEAPCFTLFDIMKRYGHNRIDVLKMDIEGSALPVVLHMITETDIRPNQIVCSLERPHFVFNASLKEVASYLAKKRKLFTALKTAGYRILTYHVGDFTAVRRENS